MQRILAHIGGVTGDASPGAAGRTGPDRRIVELNERSREIFRRIVEAYVETGEPVGSRTIARRLTEHLSPATIRNVMSDLQDLGLLFSPHTSAGRLPTDIGLRLFVNGLLEVGHLSQDERAAIDARCASVGRSVGDVLEQATGMLAGLSRAAGVVVAPKTDRPLKHIEFVNLGPGRALVVMVNSAGVVENRIIEVPLGLPPSSLIEATNYLNARIGDRTLDEARQAILGEIKEQRAALDQLTQRVVEQGLASWAGEVGSALIVRGQAALLEDVTAIEDLENIRRLFEALERGETFMKLLEQANSADDVQIFIGAENPLFAHSGCSVVIAPINSGRGPSGEAGKILGAIGVVGPTRLNYARIIPLVDYTAKVIGRLIG
jgi:heat-inducible transcriptional repressor